MKLKVCGMKHNLTEVEQLQPDYLGFIFYEKSPRNIIDVTLSSVERSSKSKYVGVFVNATAEFILEKIEMCNLEVIQLHGDETPEFCKNLKTGLDETHPSIKIWKVFSIKDNFNFKLLADYEAYADAFLFDTKGKDKGGNGYTFDWKVLKDYPSQKPLILSGGIGPEHIDDLKQLLKTDLPIAAIDVNSKFEDTPGLKNIKKLSKFIKEIASLRSK